MTESESRADHPGPDLPALAPDVIEQDLPETIDNVIPTHGYQMTPMVGLGGSAGSIGALQSFFRAMPEDSGMIFVVILHLAPGLESTLPALLGRCTSMPVVAASDGERVSPNHVYVIPPGKELTTVDGHLRLMPLQHERGRRVVVDLFFRTLADTHGPHAAAVILSGADGDGALGIKRIKERGGLTISQEPDEAENAGMPSAAIETGMVDWVLDVAEIPRRLLSYFQQEQMLTLPPEEGPQPAVDARATADAAEAALREVLTYLRTRTGRDFSYYKRATILRRIARRMQVNAVEDVGSYLAYLRTHPGEAGALLQDLLISVTNFFRDRDAFEALESHIPSLFAGKGVNDTVRVWVPACATGEEAYSIAIMLLEHARSIEDAPALQVFGCDLDEQAIARARIGVFPEACTADVSEDRLHRFFTKEHRGYRVRREVRETVLFAVHDLLKDAPFSRMDAVSCRNLLIYLNRDAQRRVLDTFQFSLRPDGLLFLGSSESIEDGSAYFRVVDKRYRLYRQQPFSARTSLPVPAGPSPLLRALEIQERTQAPVVHGRRFMQEAQGAFPAMPRPAGDRPSLAEIHFRLLERLAAPSLIISPDYEIVHLSEHAGRFLSFGGGEPSSNLLRAVHPALRIELRAALFRCSESGAATQIYNVHADVDGVPRALDISIHPVPEVAPGFMLILFELRDATHEAATHAERNNAAAEPIIRQLERELEQVKSHLRDSVEQFEASTEEMKASNEELQAMNEELRSATEELETSREELQSINEELSTVNLEMKSKVDELASANSDLQNLMASTAIATVFLDRTLAIKRHTPTAVELFHLIPTDLGRPLSHLKHRLEYPELMADAERVLRTLVPTEREVREDARWFLARLQPYRTPEDHIGGVVLTCIDITDRKDADRELYDQIQQLTQFNASAVDRELRMIELKKEVNALRARLALPDEYPLEFDASSDEPGTS